jgi:hypothetical protein
MATPRTRRESRHLPGNSRTTDTLRAAAEEEFLNCLAPRSAACALRATGVREIASVPDKRPIKPVYIRQFIALIDRAREIENK